MLTLYYKTTCPFCHKVMDFAAANNIELQLKDIYSDPVIMEDLIERGGKRQVPYLVDADRGVEMYESDDIVNYLRENHAS